MKAAREKSLARSKGLLDDTLAVLMASRYFQTMKPDLLREVLKKGTYLEVPAETPLIRESDLDDDVFLLVQGSLKVMSGEKMVLRLNTPGDIVGEFAVVSDSPRSADVITESPSRLVRLSSHLIKTSPTEPERAVQFLTVFSHIMAAKLRETSRRARLYEDAVLEAREIASSNTRLETEIEDKLREVLLYSKVVEASSEAMLITDGEGAVQRYNPAAERMLPALTRKKGRGQTRMQDLVREFDLGDYPIRPTVKPWRGEWSRGSEDEAFVLQVTVTPVIASDESLLAIAYQLRDVSLQVTQQRAIAKKNEEIQRTLLDLEATYQELQRSDRLKTETLTVISSELRGPIRKIINHTEKLMQGLADLSRDQTRGELNSVLEQGEYLRIIADNIGNLIELQSDFQSSGMVQLDMRDVVRTVCADLSFWASRKSITLDVRLPEGPLTLSGDPEQIRVALNLLVEEALMVATTSSTVRIEAGVLDNSRQVHVEIEYQGPSLQQLSPNQGPAQGRMGLLIGLPLARKVISQHQGSLQFVGGAERTCISILLPRMQKEGDERPNRIMICDTEDIDRLIVRGVIEHLWPDSVLLLSHDPFDFLDNYEDFKPDLVILDPEIYQPGWGNHRLVASLVQNRRHICPIFALSRLYNDFAERTIAVERGVTDFLSKPYSIFDLRFKVKSLLQSHRKEESLHQTMDQAQRQAFTDGLTRLANRKHFDGFLETQINYSRQTKKPCSLIMLDIDNFKHYNDTNGHQLGDEILKGVAHILAKSVRASDLAARYGGEEFVVVLPETRKDMAVVIAEKVRRTIQEAPFPNAEQQPLGFLSASFGVATYDEDAQTPEGLIKSADECLYAAKAQGRNMVVRAEPKLLKRAEQSA